VLRTQSHHYIATQGNENRKPGRPSPQVSGDGRTNLLVGQLSGAVLLHLDDTK